MEMFLNIFFFFCRMKFTRISTPKQSKRKSKKRSKKSEATDGDFTLQTRKVIEILDSPKSGILFPKKQQLLLFEVILYKKIQIFHGSVNYSPILVFTYSVSSS